MSPLSEMIVTAVQEPELIEYAAKSKGADGINLAGICCTANEVMMRQASVRGQLPDPGTGHPDGVIEAMVVDCSASCSR